MLNAMLKEESIERSKVRGVYSGEVIGAQTPPVSVNPEFSRKFSDPIGCSKVYFQYAPFFYTLIK